MKFVTLILMVLIGSSFLFAQSYNYEEMDMDQYNALLQEWQGRLDAANKAIADEDARIAQANTCVDENQAAIEKLWDEIYAALGSSREQNEEFKKQIGQLRSDANALLSMTPEEIYRRKDEIAQLKQRLADLRANNLALLSENEAALNSIESVIMQIEEKGKPAVPDTYTVMRGDYLWKIAGKGDIYGDPYAWIRIYSSNTDQIKNQDLIFPNQIFRIPRDVGPNEHLIVKGEFLSKISGYANVYGSPFQWQKLYEANKTVITDPNVVYPYTVLSIPRN